MYREVKGEADSYSAGDHTPGSSDDDQSLLFSASSCDDAVDPDDFKAVGLIKKVSKWLLLQPVDDLHKYSGDRGFDGGHQLSSYIILHTGRHPFGETCYSN